MPNIDAPAFSQDFAANGGAKGSIQVVSSAGFYAGCDAYISCDDAQAHVIIVSVPDTTHVVVRVIYDDGKDQQRHQVYGGATDVSAYTTAKHAKISMPAQLAKIEYNFTKPASKNI
jgi:hypothetical protein